MVKKGINQYVVWFSIAIFCISCLPSNMDRTNEMISISNLPTPIENGGSRAMIEKITTIQLGNANSEDSYVREYKPNDNFNNNALDMGFYKSGSDNDNRRIYLKFDTNSLPTDNANEIISVSFKLKILLAPTDSQQFWTYKVTSNWAEGTIKWSTQPTVSSISSGWGVLLTNQDQNQWKSWNITELVQDWLNGDTNHGFMIRTYNYVHDDSNNDLAVRCQSTDANPNSPDRPILEIKYQIPDTFSPDPPNNLTVTPNSWNNDNSFSLSWSNPFDHSGVIGAYYKIDSAPTSGNDFTQYVSGNGISSINSIQVPDAGTHDIYIWLKDGEGNANYENSTKTTIHYDPNPPNDFIPKANPSTWSSNTQPEISFGTEDDLSGMHYYCIKVDNGEFENASNPHQLDTQEDSEHTVTVRAYDNAGNHKDETISIFIDTTPPAPLSVNADVSEWTNNVQPTINFNTNDEPSGIHHYEIQVDDTAPVIINDSNYYQLPTQQDGMHTIKVKAFDHASNWVSDSINVSIDATDPHDIILEPDNDLWINQSNPVISYSCIDYMSNIGAYHLIIDNGDAIKLNIDNNTYRLPILSDGIHTIKLIAFDKANNSIDKTVTKKVDTQPPKSFFIVSTQGNWTSDNQPEISFSTTDDTSKVNEVSGIDHYEISIDSDDYFIEVSPFTLPVQKDGIHNISVKAIDKANNSRVEYLEILIDQTKPEMFHPTIYPSNYTSDPRPTIFFDIDDDNIDHVVIVIDGTEYSNCTSPFKIPHQEDGEHTIIIKAYDRAGNFIQKTIKITIDTTPPVITTNPKVEDLTTTSVKISWNTNEFSTSIIKYGEDKNFNYSITDWDNVTEHIMHLTGLKPNTTYHYTLGSQDSIGNGPSFIFNKSFKTKAIVENNNDQPDDDTLSPEDLKEIFKEDRESFWEKWTIEIIFSIVIPIILGVIGLLIRVQIKKKMNRSSRSRINQREIRNAEEIINKNVGDLKKEKEDTYEDETEWDDSEDEWDEDDEFEDDEDYWEDDLDDIEY